METKQAIAALGALAQETRLQLFRLLIQQGPEGLPAGVIAERLGVVPSSLSFHLQQLTHAGLITQRRASRLIIYSADFQGMNALMGYLTENCCAGAGSTAAQQFCGLTQPQSQPTAPVVRRRAGTKLERSAS